MLTVSTYKLLHFLGIFMLLMALGATFASSSLSAGQVNRWKKLAGITHGAGLLVILVAGFGLLARLGLGFEIWVIAKLLIWMALGGVVVLARRSPQSTALMWWAVLVISMLAAYLGHFKPS